MVSLAKTEVSATSPLETQRNFKGSSERVSKQKQEANGKDCREWGLVVEENINTIWDPRGDLWMLDEGVSQMLGSRRRSDLTSTSYDTGHRSGEQQ